MPEIQSIRCLNPNIFFTQAVVEAHRGRGSRHRRHKRQQNHADEHRDPEGGLRFEKQYDLRNGFGKYKSYPFLVGSLPPEVLRDS